MIKVILHEALGEQFGNEFTLDAKSPSEAVYALTKMLDGFDAVVRLNNFYVWIDDSEIPVQNAQTLHLETHRDMTVVRMALHVQGSGGDNGLWMAIAGIAIIVVAWWNPAGWVAGTQLMVAGLGGAIAISGIGQMMMPKMNMQTADEEGNRSSYGFGGAVTTTEQGNCVPVAYGECLVGGFVVAWRITTEVTTYAG